MAATPVHEIRVGARRAPVPYIAAWSRETPIVAAVITNPRRPGIAYLNENPQDRDTFGVLWSACGLGQGKGRPELGRIHPQRQRRAMGCLLCQVCAAPADVNEQGMLWLLDGYIPQPEGEVTVHPPVCLPCARQAVQFCPGLRDSYTLVRVKAPAIVGVHGTVYNPARPRPTPGPKRFVRYTDPACQWVLAGQLFVTLRGCTSVDPSVLTEGAPDVLCPVRGA